MINVFFAILKIRHHIVWKSSLLLFCLPLLAADNILWLIDKRNNCKVGFTYFKNIKKIKFNGKCIDGYAESGKLVFYTKNGEKIIYSGDFQNGLFQGMGDITFSNGNVIAGVWYSGYPYRDITVIKNGKTYKCDVESNYQLSCENAGSRFGISRQAAIARWTGDYIKQVAKDTKKQFKELMEMEANAPAYCKENRSECQAGCQGDKDCLYKCAEAFTYCYEDYKQGRNE